MSAKTTRARSLLKKWRSDLALNQTDAASRLGVQAAQLSRFENGLSSPSVKTAINIARATQGRVPVESWVSEADLLVKKAS